MHRLTVLRHLDVALNDSESMSIINLRVDGHLRGADLSDKQDRVNCHCSVSSYAVT